jgi:hypothetical protein
MNFRLKGLGAERKKLIMLGVMVAILAVVVYLNVLAPSDDTPQSATRTQRVAPAVNPQLVDDMIRPPAPEARQRTAMRPGQPGARPEFKLGFSKKQPDPATIDPTLRLDLLAKVQSVGMTGGVRNLFQFGAAPLPKTPEPKIKPASAAGAIGPPAPPAPAPPPPPPPIPLKFYGYAAPAPSGAKRIFLLDGDEILVATEGQLVKSRYKVVRVGINSVVVEDVQFKHQQTLPLEEAKEAAG